MPKHKNLSKKSRNSDSSSCDDSKNKKLLRKFRALKEYVKSTINSIKFNNSQIVNDLLNPITAWGFVSNETPQSVALNEAILFTNPNKNLFNVAHSNGDSVVIVNQAGTYIFHAKISTDQACQFTLFVNGNPLTTTTSGVNSGATQLVMLQILKFNDGDRLSLVNYLSSAGTVTLTTNAGGILPTSPFSGNNAQMAIVRIGN